MSQGAHSKSEPSALPNAASQSRSIWHQLRAFLRADVIDDWSTPNKLLQQATVLTTGLVVLYAISSQITSIPHYFIYCLTGLAMMDLMATCLASLSLRTRAYRTSGRLEAIMMTGTPLWRIILFTSLGDILRSLSRCIIYLIVAIFAAPALPTQWLPALCAFGLGFGIVLALGFVSASISIFLHRGDPLGWVHGLVSLLLSSVFFPVSMFPEILTPIAQWLPLTHILHALRSALLEGQTLTELQGDFIYLVVFFTILTPFAGMMVKFATKWSIDDGASSIS